MIVMTPPNVTDTPDSDPRDTEDGPETEATPKNIHPDEGSFESDNHSDADSDAPEGDAPEDADVEENPLFPPEFVPEDDPYLSARVERLVEPHKDDLVLWVLRHYLGLNSTEMGDYLGVHRTTVRRHMEEDGDGRVFVPYQPLGLYLPRDLSYSDVDREMVEDDYEMFVPANRGKPVVVDEETLAEAVDEVEDAMDAAADEFDAPHPEHEPKYGVEVHVGRRSLDLFF